MIQSSMYGSPSPYSWPSVYTVTSVVKYKSFEMDSHDTVIGPYTLGNSWYNSVSVTAINFSSSFGDFSLLDIEQYQGESSYLVGPNVFQSQGWNAHNHTTVVHNDSPWSSLDASFMESDTFQWNSMAFGGVSTSSTDQEHVETGHVVSTGPNATLIADHFAFTDFEIDTFDAPGYHSQHVHRVEVSSDRVVTSGYGAGYPASDVPLPQMDFLSICFQQTPFDDGLSGKG